MGDSSGHVQSLIFASMMMIIGFQTIVVGLLGDIISANRKILQDVQYHLRKMDYDHDSNKEPVYETSDLMAVTEEDEKADYEIIHNNKKILTISVTLRR
ncbi:hypothetical protein BACPEC_02339 [[Bacteroides] pectinophilus ATCC 43243]|uniref:Uncharacterized protein n=1 Tax=[Bacteroides] pectinophilus ATCC 43243 TaxID=483218 RepID=B7AUE1_9FIRM|nr:hypothetical protein BACPEC_02339 [[Bacteroides] pectinophilus ATCC 43243]